MSRALLKNSLAILLGIVFLLGGATIAHADPTADALAGVSQPAQSAPITSTAGGDNVAPIELGATGAPTITQEQLLKDFTCGVNVDFSELSMSAGLKGCVPLWTYYLVYKPTSYLLMGAGYIFDISLNLSLKREMVTGLSFINTSWTVIRDFSNMLFIFVLLYAGINTMLFGADWRKIVLQVVVIALLINFSLFFTKVVIDAGNILAKGVYDTILSGDPSKSASERLVRAFQPQMFINETMAAKADPMDMTVVFIIAAIVSVFAAYTFFRAGLLFIGRLLAFWFLMIISPFAFISTTLPKGNIFSFWWGTLLNQAFVAPVYLFLIYIILQIINVPGGILGGAFNSSWQTSWFDKLVPLILMAIMLVIAMQKALKLAEGMAGDVGAMGAKMAGSVMGAGAIVATGGTAMLARGTIGRAAATALERNTFKEGSVGKGVAKWATRASFDVRNLGIAEKGIKATGLDVGKGGGVGGFEKAAKEREKKTIESAPKMTIFEEKGIRERAEKNKKSEAEIKKTEEALEAATKATKQLEESVKVAQEQSETAVVQREKEMGYKEAQERADKDRGTENESSSLRIMAEAKDALDAAKNTQAATLKPLLNALEKAKEDQKNAAKIVEEVKKSAETIAKEIVEAENKSRKENYANKVADGWKVRGKNVPFFAGNTVAADKIRKGEKKDIEKIFEEAVKKEVEKREKSKDGGEAEEKEAEPKH